MKAEALLALFVKVLDERLSELPHSAVGPRGLRGLRGADGASGKDGEGFDFKKAEPKIREWAKEFALKFSDLTDEDKDALRGRAGREGRDGRSFVFQDHVSEIETILKNQKLTFQDFSPEEISQLTGPRGPEGRGFIFEEHADQIRAWVAEQKLTFDDFTPEQIVELRGPRGRDGRQGVAGTDGKSFSFAEHKEEIGHILADVVAGLAPDLKLKFEDLSDDEKFQIRGPRGQRGKEGKSFDFSEHEEFFRSLKPKFEEFTVEERESLKLNFCDLKPEERDALKLKFENLTDEERLLIRGARGQRGKAGRDGVDGAQGPIGLTGKSIRGLPGPIGTRGLAGADGLPGRDGADGQDAPIITDVSIVQRRGDFAFVFTFSDGSEIRTNFVSLPSPQVYVAGGGVSSGNGSGGTGTDGKSAYQIWLDQGNTGSAQDFLDSLKGANGAQGLVGPQGATGPVGDVGPTGAQGVKGDQGPQGFSGTDGKSAYQTWLDQGNTGTEADFIASLKGEKGDSGTGSGGDANQIIRNLPCGSDVFISSCVRMSESDYVEGHMADWMTLSSVVALRSGTYNSKAINATAASYRESNVIGICVGKPTPTTCDVRIAGIAQGIFYGLDVTEEYYLSDDHPGRIVPSSQAPQQNEHVFLKIGQPTAFDSLLFLRGERLVRAALADETT